MNPLVASVIRTLVPVAVGQIAAWLLLVNIVLDSDAKAGLGTFLGGLITAIYYVAVRIVEQQWPSVGILLGLPKSPDTYSKDAPASEPSERHESALEPAPASTFPAAKVDAASAAPAVEPVAVTPVFTPPESQTVA